ncbi:ankyrin repeat domain-containing protein [uncultured Victivallis sp.]|uniref:ankyrin repeat domain-containing protein n=1 Tax=uncultured Victivallis sp. TaxID=354118 RepID=UPI0025953B06|nr:ankyrin repeat domain-containing protein [uncultured Victivallis sp.]
MILGSGTRIDACDILGQTALMYAAKRGNLELVRLLLAAGADASLKDVFGKDALVHAGSEKIREAISASRAVPLPAGIRPEMTAVAASYRTSGF